MLKLKSCVVTACIGIMAGCGHSLHSEVPEADQVVEREGEDVPAWTTWENWTEPHGDKTYLFAVGIDEDLDAGEDDARAAASARASEALARYVLNRVTTYVTRGGDRIVARAARHTDRIDEGDHERDREAARSVESQDRLARAMEALSSVKLHGVETTFFLSERRGVVYARARVELGTLLDGLATDSALGAQQREEARATFAETRALMLQALEADRAEGGGR
jgi:hypothetical protein